MSLADGGHLTDGSVNFSGRSYKSVQYGLHEETGELDYDEIERLAKEHRPKLIVSGFTAYSRVVIGKVSQIADEVGAYLMADIAYCRFSGSRAYPSPMEYADVYHHYTNSWACGGLILARRILR